MISQSSRKTVALTLARFAILAIAAIALVACRQKQPESSQQAQSANRSLAPNEKPAETLSEGDSTEQQKDEDKGAKPTVKVSGALSQTQRLGDPIEVSGTILNPNPFPISHVKVSFFHMCTGEEKEAVLFENKSVAANKTMPWKASVTFEQGHIPESMLSLVNEWKKAQ